MNSTATATGPGTCSWRRASYALMTWPGSEGLSRSARPSSAAFAARPSSQTRPSSIRAFRSSSPVTARPLHFGYGVLTQPSDLSVQDTALARAREQPVADRPENAHQKFSAPEMPLDRHKPRTARPGLFHSRTHYDLAPRTGPADLPRLAAVQFRQVRPVATGGNGSLRSPTGLRGLADRQTLRAQSRPSPAARRATGPPACAQPLILRPGSAARNQAPRRTTGQWPAPENRLARSGGQRAKASRRSGIGGSDPPLKTGRRLRSARARTRSMAPSSRGPSRRWRVGARRQPRRPGA